MIGNLKLGFRIMKYGHGLKGMLMGSILMGLLGLSLSVVSVSGESTDTALPGGYFFMVIGLFMIQLLYSVNMTGMIQASPLKKRLTTSVPTVLSMFAMLAGYLVTVLVEGILAATHSGSMGVACAHIVFTVGSMSVVALYMGVAYKLFVAATVIFVVAFLGFYSVYCYIMGKGVSIADGSWGTFGLIALVGLAVILVCNLLGYFLSLLLYRVPISRMSQTASLRRQM